MLNDRVCFDWQTRRLVPVPTREMVRAGWGLWCPAWAAARDYDEPPRRSCDNCRHSREVQPC